MTRIVCLTDALLQPFFEGSVAEADEPAQHEPNLLESSLWRWHADLRLTQSLLAGIETPLTGFVGKVFTLTAQMIAIPVPLAGKQHFSPEWATSSLYLSELSGRAETPPTPQAERAGQYTKKQTAIALLDGWLRDDSGYDEGAWPDVKKSIEEHRLARRKRFAR